MDGMTKQELLDERNRYINNDCDGDEVNTRMKKMLDISRALEKLDSA